MVGWGGGVGCGTCLCLGCFGVLREPDKTCLKLPENEWSITKDTESLDEKRRNQLRLDKFINLITKGKKAKNNRTKTLANWASKEIRKLKNINPGMNDFNKQNNLIPQNAK